MSRALLAIGVSNAANLVPLPGASQDAKGMYDWAIAERYQHVKLLTDETPGSAVVFDDIYSTISDFLTHGDLERLIVYFSGHGYSPAPQTETLLLTNWFSNGNQAINLSQSLHFAQSYSHLQISIIVDACRTTWPTHAAVFGQNIFPRPAATGPLAKVDEFYATRFGAPSQETDQQNGPGSFGVFSKQLIEALNGDAAEAQIARGAARVVTSLSLEHFLNEAVPEASGSIPGAQVQYPDLTPKWREPNDIYISIPGAEGAVLTHGGPTPGPEFDRPTAVPQPSARVIDARAASAAGVSRRAASIRAIEGRHSFETGNGITVVGAGIEAVYPAVEGASDIFEQGGSWHVRLADDALGTRLVQLGSGAWKHHWLVVAAFPQRLAAAGIDQQGFSSLNYRPPANVRGLQQREIVMEECLADASAALLQGVLPTKKRLQEIIDTLRADKSANPALAVIAAHICQRMGKPSIIEDMQSYEIGGGKFTPYDLPLLGPRQLDPTRKLVGDCPLMSRGWAFLPPNASGLLKAVARHVTPSLWTMLTPEGGERMQDYLKSIVATGDPTVSTGDAPKGGGL